MASRIEDYAIIGDCQTSALVARNGSIDWLCWPRFDSSACFASLLGEKQNGYWKIAPLDEPTHITRQYRESTLILETQFETETGAVLVIDFMPMGAASTSITRLVIGKRGRATMNCELVVRFDYGNAVPWVTRLSDGDGISAIVGPDMVVFRSPVPLSGKDLTTQCQFDVEEGQCFAFALSYQQSHLPVAGPFDIKSALENTEAFWRDWSSRFSDGDELHGVIERSLITLKALTYAPTGGVVAAVTTSLPEQLGGTRNWDYRYCWLRDATLTLMTLMNAGYYEEAEAWRRWLVRAVAGSPEQVQIMYGIGGERRLEECEISWLAGYENAKPVRIGNAASNQMQIDVYGELMDALHQARKGALEIDEAAWSIQCALLKHLETIWNTPDEGIWEVRGGRQHFSHSKIMAWVAFDRAVKSVEEYGLEGPLQHWRELRDEIHRDVCKRGFNSAMNSFVQVYDGDTLDASLLQIALVGFLPADDSRVIGTVAAIERDLMVDGLVRRYHTHEVEDGLPPGEGVFLACSFWLADNYILQERYGEARTLFDRLVKLSNDVGLLSEEYEPVSGRLVGNFPQAFSHLALIHTAMNLATKGRIAKNRCEKAA
ncbi:MAG: glucoamylase [Verrucomicrobiaceae bacterium]|nr:glucoamylase [Verrucomicrobiaceae bacterium]